MLFFVLDLRCAGRLAMLTLASSFEGAMCGFFSMSCVAARTPAMRASFSNASRSPTPCHLKPLGTSITGVLCPPKLPVSAGLSPPEVFSSSATKSGRYAGDGETLLGEAGNFFFPADALLLR